MTSPCTACGAAGNVTQTDGCLWTWSAPANENEGSAIEAAPAPSSSGKCRCTTYTPATIRDWLCSASTPCNDALNGTQCAEYGGSRRCFLRKHWGKIMEMQGLGPEVNSLVLGGGDRYISMSLKSLECACDRWGLTTYTPKVTVFT